MNVVNLLAWIVVGGISGFLSGRLLKTRMELAADIVVGIIGALIGGMALSVFPILTLVV